MLTSLKQYDFVYAIRWLAGTLHFVYSLDRNNSYSVPLFVYQLYNKFEIH